MKHCSIEMLRAGVLAAAGMAAAAAPADLPLPSIMQPTAEEAFKWTPQAVALATAVFIAAGLFEIGGGWLVWQTVRDGKQWWMAALGGLVLAAYGFVACLNPLPGFGRVYAIYGGFFIVMSFAWARVVDGFKFDAGDIVGGTIALAGVLVIMLWPRPCCLP
mmetsp:Transcript_131718/g.340846  ORF Transcript_131718/g.340846 Transcript_131718/m.340846 type:complete len:161 (-) Transcript_131718:327-809(-)